jgi:23S rRNA pseudouridine2605 synthase
VRDAPPLSRGKVMQMEPLQRDLPPTRKRGQIECPAPAADADAATRRRGPFRYLMLHKPAGCLCARVPPPGKETPTVYDHLAAGGYPLDLGHVGRLDLATEGLLLFTDDGLLLQALTNSRPTTRDGSLPAGAATRVAAAASIGASGDGTAAAGVVKTYVCEIRGQPPSEAQLEQMRMPYTYGESKNSQRAASKKVTTLPALVRRLPPSSVAATSTSAVGAAGPQDGGDCNGEPALSFVEVRIVEGRNRQVRRLVKRSRMSLHTLRRVALGPVSLGDLPLGHARWLTPSEVGRCYAVALPGHVQPDIAKSDLDTNGDASGIYIYALVIITD